MSVAKSSTSMTLKHSLCAFAPPHHQSSHEQGDQYWHCDERGEDTDRWIMEEPAGQSTIVEVGLVNLHEESVNYLIGPEAIHPHGHLVSAVCQTLIDLCCVRPAAPQAWVQSSHVEFELS